MSTSSVLYDAPGPKARRLSRIVSVVAAVVIGGAVIWLLWALGQPRVTVNGTTLTGLWSPERWDIFGDPQVWRRLILEGLVMGTLRAAALAAVLSLILGVVLCFARTAPQRWISVPAAVILEFFRGMPVLLMMLFILLALGTGGYTAVVLALTVYNGAIIGEALRAGLSALPRGQREAGLSLGLTSLQTRITVEFPQALRQMLPIIVAQLVVLLKDTSLGYVVSYPEILRVSGYMKDFYGSTRYSFPIFIVVLLTYLAVNFSLSAFARWLARRSGPRAGAMAVAAPTPTEQP
ncbi:MAG: amino acid ABC transporter permease [Tessaracoccus sp.]|uniref:amino acid ABC transporter permease n=1 Tax=Tessaracoccus sp. TaxID=1971211 RepID=UPI001EBD3B34|nr:amino acid ABC transporter permease [Tessaracoccus sp.]MBK7822715.1 amino acid ABC transporter permease [Tessaracoccus sp.]